MGLDFVEQRDQFRTEPLEGLLQRSVEHRLAEVRNLCPPEARGVDVKAPGSSDGTAHGAHPHPDPHGSRIVWASLPIEHDEVLCSGWSAANERVPILGAPCRTYHRPRRVEGEAGNLFAEGIDQGALDLDCTVP